MAKNKPNQGARKTETLTLRLDPKIKFLIEIISRHKRQSITGVIESAIDEYAKKYSARARLLNEELDGEISRDLTLRDLCDQIYSTDDSFRFLMLALTSPQLLNHEEIRLKETIYASKIFWYEYPNSESVDDDIDHDTLRENWDQLMEHMTLYKDSNVVVPFEPK